MQPGTPTMTQGTPQNYCPSGSFDTIKDVFSYVSCTLIKYVVPMLFALAVVMFIWGIMRMFLNPDNEEERKKGKSFMMWGIIAFVVMTSIWGIVKIFTSSFGIDVLVIPQVRQ